MTHRSDTHESFVRKEDVKISSERSFGIVFFVVFAIIGAWPLIRGADPRWWSLGMAAAFLAAAFVFPKALRPLNLLWAKVGLLLHRITNPLIIGLVFFLAVTPTALVMKALGKDPLRRRIDPNAKSYWIERAPPGPAPDTMHNQF
jgi:predicted membrane metal-binding protein